MKKSRARLDAWAEVHKRFHLSDLPLQMARALGLNPKQCGGLANHWQEPWKLPLPEFIAECYRKRFHRERPAQVVPSPRSRSGTSNRPATRPDTHENAPTPDALQQPSLTAPPARHGAPPTPGASAQTSHSAAGTASAPAPSAAGQALTASTPAAQASFTSLYPL